MRSRLAPAVVIAVSAVVTASIIAGELVLLAKFDKVAATFGLPQLSTATLPDGTVLTLHYVFFGRNHALAVPVGKQQLRWGAAPSNLRSVTMSTNPDRVVFFVSRHDPETKEFLDFEAWSHCRVTDAFGDTVEDEHPHRFVNTTSSSKSEGRDRGPFPPLPENDRNYPREGRRILLGIRMRAFRAPASPQLDFIDVDGNKLASLPFVNPIPGSSTEWKPSSLPVSCEVTKVDDPTSAPASSFHGQRELEQPVSVTLKSLELTSRSSRVSNGQVNEYRPLKFDAELLVDGQRSNVWRLSTGSLSDPLGNEAHFGNATLSLHEPAWRVTLKASRTIEAEFAESERCRLTGLKTPVYGGTDSQLASIRVDGAGIIPLAFFGRGRGKCDVPQAGPGTGSYRTGGSIRLSGNGNRSRASSRYNINWQPNRYSGTANLVKDSELPCLFVLTNSLHPDVQLLVRTVDSEGREVPSHVRNFYDFAHLIFFEADPRDGELTCEVLMQTPVEFEFFVEPPQLKQVKK